MKLNPYPHPNRIQVAVDGRFGEQGFEPELEGRLQDDGEAFAELMFPAHAGEEAVVGFIEIAAFVLFAVGRAGISGVIDGLGAVGQVIGKGQADHEVKVVIVVQLLEELQLRRGFDKAVDVNNALFGGARRRRIIHRQGGADGSVAGIREPKAGLEAGPLTPPLGKEAGGIGKAPCFQLFQRPGFTVRYSTFGDQAAVREIGIGLQPPAEFCLRKTECADA